jgi:hypothetical protein
VGASLRTYPIFREDGSIHAFEISNVVIRMRTIRGLLEGVPGVSAIRRVWFREQRMQFKLRGEDCEVWEPFGDNSRYWVGPSDAKSSKLELSQLHSAFAHYSGPFTSAVRRFARLIGVSRGRAPN